MCKNGKSPINPYSNKVYNHFKKLPKKRKKLHFRNFLRRNTNGFSTCPPRFRQLSDKNFTHPQCQNTLTLTAECGKILSENIPRNPQRNQTR